MLGRHPDRVIKLSITSARRTRRTTALKLNILGMDNWFEAARLTGSSAWCSPVRSRHMGSSAISAIVGHRERL